VPKVYKKRSSFVGGRVLLSSCVPCFTILALRPLNIVRGEGGSRLQTKNSAKKKGAFFFVNTGVKKVIEVAAVAS